MEKEKKLSFSISSKQRPPKPPSRPAVDDDAPPPSASAPAQQFVTEFDPSQTLPPAAAAPVVIPPLPNSFHFGPRKPSSLPTSGEEAALAAQFPAAASVLDTSAFPDDDDPSSCTFYGLNLRDAAAALLAGYGWSEGQCVGKSHRGRKEDTKAVRHGDRHRHGKPGLGYNPSEHGPRKSRSGDWTFAADNKMTGNGTVKKRGRDTTEDKDRNAGGEGNQVLWLHSHIRVRVVSEKLGKRLHLMKGKVVDVVAPAACDVVMDDGSELVQGVEQGMLETVLPRTNGRVLVLCGKHKGVCGRLLEKDSEEKVGLVEDADSKAVVRVKYDQMAEYTGDL